MAMADQPQTSLARTAALLRAFKAGTTQFDQLAIAQASFANTFLPFISIEKAQLAQADFRHAVLPGAKLNQADLARANFEHANLLGADLSQANLNQAKLDHALVATANLKRVNLRGASLIGASLAKADLSFADLRNANLTGVNLQGANLSQANLFGSRVTPKTLNQAILDRTILPSGHCHTGAWTENSPDPGVVEATAAPLAPWSAIANGSDPDTIDPVPPVQTSQRHSRLLPSGETAASPAGNSGDRPRLIGFRVAENSADLILEILDGAPLPESGGFICINHLLPKALGQRVP